MLDGIGGETRVLRGPELEFREGRPECFFGAGICDEVTEDLVLELVEAGQRVQYLVDNVEDVSDFVGIQNFVSAAGGRVAQEARRSCYLIVTISEDAFQRSLQLVPETCPAPRMSS